jgi:hypothetical protein
MTNSWLSLFDAATPAANNASNTAPDFNAKVSFGSDGSGWLNGVIRANGSAAITGAPPAAAQISGWKAVLWGSNYAFGVASYTLAVMTKQWLSLFADATPPANNGTGTAPDSNAKVSFGKDGSCWFTGNVGFFGRTPVGQQSSSGAVMAGSSYGSTEKAMLQ